MYKNKMNRFIRSNFIALIILDKYRATHKYNRLGISENNTKFFDFWQNGHKSNNTATIFRSQSPRRIENTRTQ